MGRDRIVKLRVVFVLLSFACCGYILGAVVTAIAHG